MHHLKQTDKIKHELFLAPVTFPKSISMILDKRFLPVAMTLEARGLGSDEGSVKSRLFFPAAKTPGLGRHGPGDLDKCLGSQPWPDHAGLAALPSARLVLVFYLFSAPSITVRLTPKWLYKILLKKVSLTKNVNKIMWRTLKHISTEGRAPTTMWQINRRR